jgi:hypothetical protein
MNILLVQTSAGEWLQSFVQVFECNPMTKHSVLKKYVWFFHIIQTIFIFLMYGYGHGEKQ